MGLNNEDSYRRSLVFDIETAPITNADEFIDAGSFSAPANWKDPVKIEANIAEQKASAIGKAALDPDLARIVALGLYRDDTDCVVIMADTEEREVEALEAFWYALGPYPYPRLIGFNVLGFDLPVIVRRSQYLGIKAKPLQMGRYRHPDVDDLMTILNFDGAIKTHSLKFYAKRFGCLEPDPVEGKDIVALVEAKDWASVSAHCRADLVTTAALARKLGVMQSMAVGAF